MTQLRRFDPARHHRRSIRLKGYDYSRMGSYFITLCTSGREHLFGKVEGGEMILNPFGQIALNEWIKSAEIRPEISLGEFVVMPNHVHGIITIHDMIPVGHTPVPVAFRSPARNIGAVVRGYKSAVTKTINVSRNTPKKPVWQRNYYDQIIRDDKAYIRISNYIRRNPKNWRADDF